MNMALSFLAANRERLNLAAYGANGALSAVVITPRFRASSHVLFLISAGGRSEPVIVAKTPRLAQATTSIEREVSNLRAVQALRLGGFDSIPRVVAYEEHCGYPILVETALVGKHMDPNAVRHNLAGCCQKVVAWLADLHQFRNLRKDAQDDWFDRLIDEPLGYFSERFPVSKEEQKLLEQTRALIAPLRTMNLPLVFEHGDLSHPNLLIRQDGALGVLDWELADPYGLPAYDLFFFLTYAAFALADARNNGAHLPAFQSAFWGPTSWAAPYVEDYVQQLGLPTAALKPLFVFAWLRYLVGLLKRLDNTTPMNVQFGTETANWLRTNRYYSLWHHAVTHAHELSWS
jgi:aminoglycoside phosphotransferase (APT) family kinase protein